MLEKEVITCPKCDGDGTIQLSQPLADTMSLFASSNTLTAEQCAAARPAQICITAWNNRLSKLFQCGLLDRTRSGKQWIYRRR